MLALPPRSVAQAILSLFTAQRELRAEDIHARINSRYFPCSARSVYKELRRLAADGVVLRVRGYYSLSITWILNLLRFSEELYDRSVSSRPIATRLPAEGERVTWRFHDLEHLDRFWIQMIFLLFEHSRSRTMFAWVPHFWFDLVHYEKDLEAQEAMKIAGNRMYMLLGGDTYLDRLPEKYWSKDVYEWSYAESPFEAQRNRYFDVIDDFIMTITLDPVTTARLGDLFTRIRSKADLGLVREFERWKNDARVTMTLERSRAKSKRLRRKCCDFFGIADPAKG